MGCFSDSPSDSADAGVPSDASPPSLPGGVPDPPRDPTSPVAACPNSCANTLYVNGCTVVGINDSIELYANADYVTSEHARICDSGSIHWSSPSAKITLSNVDSSTVTVKAGAHPSGGRGQEVVTCTWSLADCETLTKSINITVVNVRFSESAAESYGYDDMDTPAVWTDDHVSLRKYSSTVVHVVVEGGVNGNELTFTTLDATTATVVPPPAQPAFDLTVLGWDQDKAETNLVVRADCPAASEITRMFINVYREKVIRAVVAKVFDVYSPLSYLKYPKLDVASAKTLINPKAKAAVVRYEFSDYSPTGDAVNILYDEDSNGKLNFDIAAGGGKEFNTIRDEFTSSDTRIAVVRELFSFYYLDADAAAGTSTIKLRGISDNNYLVTGGNYPLGTGGNAETVAVLTSGKSTATVTLSSALRYNHVAGETLEFNAGAWGGSPIVIQEGQLSETDIKWTFFHETGHYILTLADVVAAESIMNWTQGWTDHRLRYKPLANTYGTGTENQWQTIPRD